MDMEAGAAILAERVLDGLNILVAEDEYIIAREVAHALRDAGAIVLGPASSVATALALVEDEGRIDAALLDVNLRGEHIYAIADMLRGRHIPYILVSGYDLAELPDQFADAPHLQKPVTATALVNAVARLVSH